MTEELAARAARGTATTLVGQALRMGVQLVAVVVLARLLSPGDYGLMALVTVVVGVGEVFRDFGLSTAAVTARHVTEAQRSNLFWVNVVLGVALGTAAFACAPLVAAGFDEPALAGLTRAMAVVFVLNGMATQYRADLNRRMRFRRLVVADVAAPVVALVVAIVLAAEGAGYWALAVQQLVSGTVMLVVVVWSAGWLPGPPRRGVPLRSFVRFGWGLVGSQLVGYAANNVDSVVIGARLGAADLGHYNRAFQLLMVPLNQVRSPATQVALPVLSRVQDDRRRLAAYLERGQAALGYSVVAGLGVVAGGAAPVTAIFLGPRWDAVAPLLALIAVAGAFQLLAFVGYWAYLATGLTGRLFSYSWVSAAVKITCVLVGSHWGVVGVAAGYALAPALSWPISLWWLARSAELSVRPLYQGAARILLVLAAVAGASAAAAQVVPGPAAVQLLGCVVAGLMAYAAVVAAAPGVRDGVRGVAAFARLAVRR